MIFDAIIILYIIKRESWIFTLAFFAGLLMDIIYVRTFGATSLFFLSCLFLVFLYERKYEIATRQFTFFFLLLTSFVYFKLFNGQFTLFYSLLNAGLGAGIFAIVRMTGRFGSGFAN